MKAKRGALHAALVVFALVLGGIAAVVSVEQSEAPPSSPHAGTAAQHPRRSGPLLLAGSGSNLPLTRRLAQSWMAAGGGEAQVLTSIGSGGGLQALSDGVIDIALVSRPLREDERATVDAVAYARAAIVVATRLEIERMDVRTLRAIYAGTQTETPDGQRIVPILREEGDSTFAALSASDAEFGVAIREAQHDERFRRVFTDQSMEHVLSTVHGALGLLDQGFLHAQSTHVHSVPLGPRPSPEVLERGEYPYTKDLLFALPRTTRASARAFVDFVRGPIGRRIIRDAAYMPLMDVVEPGEGPN
ncbi:MAG: phosphate transport system substrate-binding protein [Polyangiales bacterium]|jgi:phosphate transport system substrate-binding protein